MSAIEIAQDHHGIVRILVADVDNGTRSRYRESLRRLGCDVVEAADGREALVHALSHRPTLVVIDADLPVIDGYALCDVLRRDSVTRGVPILVVTTETQPTELDRARDAGADGVLIKPVSPDVLLNEIQRLLRHPEQTSTSGPLKPTAARAPKARSRKPLNKDHSRFETTAPPNPPPTLVCRVCDRPLLYEQSYLGGVNARQPERWDHYRCPGGCGTFVYRHRTGKVRRVERTVGGNPKR